MTLDQIELVIKLLVLLVLCVWLTSAVWMSDLKSKIKDQGELIDILMRERNAALHGMWRPRNL